MVLIFSGHANASGQVRREVERAISQGMTVLVMRVEDVRPEGSMEFALGNTHWLDAFTPPVERKLEKLARSVQTLLANDGKGPETQTLPPIPNTRIDEEGSSKVGAGAAGSPNGRIRRVSLAGLALVVVVLAAVIVIPRLGPSRDMTPPESSPLNVETAPSVNLGTVKPADRPKPQPKVPDKPQKLITNSIEMKLVLIPSGGFMMGSTKGAPEEEPPHLVRITRPLFLGQYEVTQEEYEKIMGNNPSKVKGVHNPVESVSWLDALRFCNMLSRREGLKPFYEIKGELVTAPNWDCAGYRLPTEAEWEYACRAGRDGTFGFGDGVPLQEFSWYFKTSGKRPHSVGLIIPNQWGLYDIHGNVYEMCWDISQPYSSLINESSNDPKGPDVGDSRVVRGGGFNSNYGNLRASHRGKMSPLQGGPGIGFRVARTFQSGTVSDSGKGSK